LRGGLIALEEVVAADSSTTVFPVDAAGNVSGPQDTIVQNNLPHAFSGGLYLQDEWKIVPQLTFNGGARFDVYNSTTDDENQLSPRANLIYRPWETTSLHIGYARYFTPPPLETVPAENILAFDGTSGASAVTAASPVKAERANYYDAGISQTLLPGWQMGLDGYYKTAQNQLDDGFFGQSLILSSFNYTRGRIRGVELTTSYTTGGFSAYASLAFSVAQGEGAESAQFLWPDQTTVNYVNNKWVYLDHDQRVTGSFGVAYTWNESPRLSTRLYSDALYGSGLRKDGSLIPGTDVATPNGATVPQYYELNLGAEESFKVAPRQFLKLRIDVVNIGDNIYALRTGTGIGVNAAQYGMRRGIFGSLSYVF
jgi:outer membrane receptor protein involved in Fe transport